MLGYEGGVEGTNSEMIAITFTTLDGLERNDEPRSIDLDSLQKCSKPHRHPGLRSESLELWLKYRVSEGFVDDLRSFLCSRRQHNYSNY